jgi:hypothetical protein
MTCKWYRSTDASAPVLTRQVGTTNALLKAICVNGYGAKSSLGWTLEYEDSGNNVCVFRTKLGTRMYVQVNDNAPGALYNVASIQAYKIMSSAYIGIEPCPIVNASTSAKIFKDYTNTNNSTVINWEVIGDEYGIWIIPYLNATYPSTGGKWVVRPTYIGDYIPFDITNTYNFCILSSSSYASDEIRGYNYNYASADNLSVLRGSSMSYGCVPCSLYNNSNSPSIGNNFIGITDASISPINGRTISHPIYIQTSDQLIGVIPGLRNPLTNYSNVTLVESDVIPIVTTDGSNTEFLASSMYSSNIWTVGSQTQRLLFNIGDKFRNVY